MIEQTSNRFESITLRLPSFAVTAIVNGDEEGLTEDEIHSIDLLYEKYGRITVPCPDGEPFFSYTNDLPKYNLGSDCYDIECLIQDY